MTATATKAEIKEYSAADGIGQRLAEVQRLTLEIEALKESLDKEKAYLFAHAVRQNYSGLRCGALLVSRRVTTSWCHSQATKNAEARVKARKAKEQANGAAIGTKAESLVVNVSGKIALQLAADKVAALDAILEQTPSIIQSSENSNPIKPEEVAT